MILSLIRDVVNSGVARSTVHRMLKGSTPIEIDEIRRRPEVGRFLDRWSPAAMSPILRIWAECW